MSEGDQVREEALAFRFAKLVKVDINIGTSQELGAELRGQMVPRVAVDGIGASAVALGESMAGNAARKGQLNGGALAMRADRAFWAAFSHLKPANKRCEMRCFVALLLSRWDRSRF